jgi:hypothetical protein
VIASVVPTVLELFVPSEPTAENATGYVRSSELASTGSTASVSRQRRRQCS